jgi:hypothetical protein
MRGNADVERQTISVERVEKFRSLEVQEFKSSEV